MMTSWLLPQASSTDMMMSWLLPQASSSRHADVIIAESRFLFASNPSADFSISFNQQC
ncbi:hypothetical protein F511_47733 [Dorcoceras hygrometricum]|uniref:Uncharacterized protein n=1 Tax=Dorcoceras hygrometricum TaxID=472368 RepID=A0A2Z6ZQD0_9LAMI|nr:hypothetical protein F511_47733 [Dorcoceras hygrometricum]